MSEVFDLFEKNTAQEILRQYSNAWGMPVFLLDTNKKVILKSPEDAQEANLRVRPIHLRDSVVCYVGQPETAESRLDFIGANLSKIIEMGYEIDSLSAEVARNYEELSLLWKISSRLGAKLNVEMICKVLADEVMSLCPSRNVSVFLVSQTTDPPTVPHMKRSKKSSRDELKKAAFIPKVSLGVDADLSSMLIFDVSKGLLGHVFENKVPVTVCDVSKDERFEGFPYPVKRILVVPLTVEDAVIGSIVATDKLTGEEYYATEIKLISSIALECAISIKKAIFFEEIRNILFGVAESFSLAIDAKDPYTFGHSKRVSQMAAAVAKEMGYPPDAVNWVRLAGLLHDIGKIGTPEGILHKGSQLNNDELDRIKEHPVIGAKMIEYIRRMREIAQWVCHHHERYDGEGYPSGLEGDEIPFPSRIIAVADYFDALTSERPYRKAISKEEAFTVMRETAVGTHLDPAVFDFFVRVVT